MKYEIRIIKRNESALIYFEESICDFTAIRRAQILAQARNAAFEVWRGMECIFRRASATPVS